MPEVDLTIIMPSWNKEKYIAEALDSVFAQETSYTYRILVADDHSTDRTLEIVEDYSSRHPGVITVLRSDSNLKLFRNVRRAYELCKTPYFCVLDPDDFWTDVRHLEKALAYLSGHSDYTIYSAGIELLSPNGSRRDCGFPKRQVDSDFLDYQRMRAVIAFTQTCVYRNVIFDKGLPAPLRNPPSQSCERSFRGDSFRNFIHIREGRSHFEPGIEACYRETQEGVFQGLAEFGRLLLNARLYLDFWEYDGRAHIGILAQSRKIFSRAGAMAFSSLSSKSVTEPQRLSYLTELAALEKIYGEYDLQLTDFGLREARGWEKVYYWTCRRLKRRRASCGCPTV